MKMTNIEKEVIGDEVEELLTKWRLNQVDECVIYTPFLDQ